jgi:CubicO group peptidase (beta-lactamase class C family)
MHRTAFFPFEATSMKRILHTVLIGWLLAGIVVPASAKDLPRVAPEKAGFSADKLDKVRSVVQGAVDREQTAGVVLMVARHGKVVLCESFGKMDVAAGKAMRPDTIFRIYSMTKPITTAAAMMLYEEGRLGLDDPVSKYLPDFKGLRLLSGKGDETVPARREMTIRDLMRHSSGLIHADLAPGTPLARMYRQSKVEEGNNSLADMVRKLGKVPLLFQPGTRFHYGVSTDVLGRVIEVVSGKPLDEFFQERLLGPLRMRDTGFFVPPDKLPRFSAMYGPGPKGGLRLVEAPANSRFRSRPRFLSGGGGLVSTVDDYLRFCQMMLDGGQLHGKRLLRAETVRQMTSNQLPAEAMPLKLAGMPLPGRGFGLGFSVRLGDRATASEPWVGEYGWGGYASTHFWVAPGPGLVAVIMQQYVPTTLRLELALKPLIYEALQD